PQLLTGDIGLRLTRSEPASTQLLDDLRADKGMEWVPRQQWLTYMQIDTPAALLRHDLAASVDPLQLPTKSDAGIASDTEILNTLTGGHGRHELVPVMAVALALLALVIIELRWRRRRSIASR